MFVCMIESSKVRFAVEFLTKIAYFIDFKKHENFSSEKCGFGGVDLS